MESECPRCGGCGRILVGTGHASSDGGETALRELAALREQVAKQERELAELADDAATEHDAAAGRCVMLIRLLRRAEQQLAAEREKRAALVREFRRRADERKDHRASPLGHPSAVHAAWHDAAVLLAALDQEGA